MLVELASLQHTSRLGRALAQVYTANPFLAGLILLQGDLGAGKTTFTRFMVESLPGGSSAEVSSPSFTLCNEYPTDPPVLHFDLYRLQEGQYAEALLDALDEAEHTPIIILVEWPERMQKTVLPQTYIHCRLTECENNRRASFESHGANAVKLLELFKVQARLNGLI